MRDKYWAINNLMHKFNQWALLKEESLNNNVVIAYCFFSTLCFIASTSKESVKRSILDLLEIDNIDSVNFQMEERDKDVLSFFSSIWINKSKTSPEFVNTLLKQSTKQNSEVKDLTYKHSDINEWVKEKTKGLIDEVVTEIKPTTNCIFVDGLTFIGKFLKPFEKEDTVKKQHINLNGEIVDVMMMRGSRFECSIHESYMCLHVPYLDCGIKMIIVRPNGYGKDALLEVGEIIKKNGMKAIYGNVSYTTTVYIPRQDVSSTSYCSDFLEDHGVSEIFRPGGVSDFEKEMSINDINLKARFKTNEEGTKAAAVCDIVYESKGCSKRVRRVLVFSQDKPCFVYFVSEQSKDKATEAMILFSLITTNLPNC